ncbi:MAG: TIGR02450 family Trp-rich protein [Methylococcaceae bacterium]
MNQINPNKLLLSKWTAVHPKQKERHFIVTKLIRAETPLAEIIACELEAVINNKVYEIDWQTLKDKTSWQMGWL